MITPYIHTVHSISTNDNVIERYKRCSTDEIKACLQKDRTGLITVFENLQGDFNVSSAIRSHNAFLGSSVYIVGRRRYDKRGCVGTHHYENIYHADTIQETIEHLHSLGYNVFAVDNEMKYKPINLMEMRLPYNSAFVFGEEGPGLTKAAIELCDAMVYVRQYGSVRSMNVACCASIIEYEYSRQWRN